VLPADRARPPCPTDAGDTAAYCPAFTQQKTDHDHFCRRPRQAESDRQCPLRSDGAKLEDALKAAGVPVQRQEYEGVAHEFFGAAAVLQKARDAQAYAGLRLRESW
jgi:acetyl esterase/lipase